MSTELKTGAGGRIAKENFKAACAAIGYTGDWQKLFEWCDGDPATRSCWASLLKAGVCSIALSCRALYWTRAHGKATAEGIFACFNFAPRRHVSWIAGRGTTATATALSPSRKSTARARKNTSDTT